MGYMFESEIDLIINAVRARTIGEEESITLKEVLAADIHPAIKAYFKAEIEQLLQKERQIEVRSKQFPYTLPEVVRLQQQIDLLLVHHYHFGRHDFETMLDHAVHFQFNFLCRPQWTLLSFVFENQRRRSAQEIERKLRYCVDYVYYAEILKRYIEERGLAELTFEEFSTLLEKIDREIVARHTSVELALMARPLLKFIDAGRPSPANGSPEATIPINAAIVFFEDKKLNAVKERLERERDEHGLNDVTLLQLANFIEKVHTGNEEAEVEFPLPVSAPAQSAGTGAAPGSEPEAELHPPEKQEAAPSSTQSGEALAAEAAQEGKPPARVFSDFDDPLMDELRRKFGPLAQPAPPTSAGSLVDVYNLISPHDRKVFVRKIFKKDEVEFRNALDELNRITDWKTASEYIEQVFLINDVDPFSEEAVRFTDTVQSRYLSPEAGEPGSSM